MNRQSQAAGLAISMSLSLLLCSVGLAESSSSSDADLSSIALEEIIVTAQRREEALSRTPLAIQVVTGEAFAKRSIVSELDLQTAVPGLTVKAGQTANSLNFSLRGQTVDANSSSRSSVLPYINEVQVGGGSSKGGSSVSSLYDLQSMQVVKGPQGTLFGRNSTGGAILFTTAKPTNEFEGYVTGWAGNFSDVKFEGAVNIPIVSDIVLMRLSGYYQQRDGYQKNLLDDSRLGDVDRHNLRLSLTANPTSAISNELVLDYGKSEGTNVSSVANDVYPAESGLGFVPSSFLYSPLLDVAYGPGSWDAFVAAHPELNPAGMEAAVREQRARGPYRVRLDSTNFHEGESFTVTNATAFEVGESTRIRSILGYSNIDYGNAAEYDGTEFPADNSDGVIGTLEQLSAELQLQGEAFDGQLDYVSGLFYSKEREKTRATTVLVELLPMSPAVIQPNTGEIENETVAIYGQGTLDLSNVTGIDGLGITLGVRYSSEKVTALHGPDDVYIVNPPPPGAVFQNPLSDTFENVSWTVGLNQQVNEQLLLYAVSRRSFRSGGFNFYAPPLPGFGNDGGAEFKEEQATDVEIGAKFNGFVGGAPLQLNAAAYKMWIDDIQRSNFVEVFGSLAGITVNVPEAQVSGVEIDVQASPTSWFTFGGAVSYTDAEFTDNLVSVLGNPAVAFGPYPDTPEWSASLFGEVTYPISERLALRFRGDLYNQTSMYYSSTADTLNPGARIPGYTIGNLSVAVENASMGWTLAAHVKNVTDEEYYIGGVAYKSLLSMNTVMPGNPRVYVIEGRFSF